MFIIIYRKAEWLNCQTQHIGPFHDHDSAYEYLCTLPAPGPGVDGCKYIEELIIPSTSQLNQS